MSPRKGVLQTPRTPRRNDSNHRTPRSLRADRQLLFASPPANRTPQTQTGIGTRAFLLPPPSPCALPTPQGPRRVSGSTPIVPHDSGTLPQAPSRIQNVQWKDCEEEDTLSRGLNEVLVEHAATPPVQCHPSRGNIEPNDINTDGDADLLEEEYASSPLPPSSPLPASPLSSSGPTKYNDNHALPDANGQRTADAAWLLPDDSVDPTTAWFTDSDVGVWLTETEAWQTDTEGEPLPTDSDGAWLSDSDGIPSVFGNLASWLSDEADVETDGEVGAGVGTHAMGQDDAGFDTAAFRRVYESLVEHGGASVDADGTPDGDVTPGTQSDTGLARPIKSDFWESIRPLMGEDTLDDVGTASGAAHNMQALLDSLVGT